MKRMKVPKMPGVPSPIIDGFMEMLSLDEQKAFLVGIAMGKHMSVSDIERLILADVEIVLKKG